jgi:hypothetical protein
MLHDRKPPRFPDDDFGPLWYALPLAPTFVLLCVGLYMAWAEPGPATPVAARSAATAPAPVATLSPEFPVAVETVEPADPRPRTSSDAEMLLHAEHEQAERAPTF